MLRFGINGYIRNFWYNLCVVLLLFVMMLISTILISNMDVETGQYRLAEKYMDDDSVFLSSILREYVEDVNTYGDMLTVQIFDGRAVDKGSFAIRASVYTEEVMNYLKPRLDSGNYPEYVKSDENSIRVLISHNPYGIKAGDIFTYEVDTVDSQKQQLRVHVTGVISEGQRLYTENGQKSKDMTYENFFQLYSYEQTERVRMIIPEEELEKIPEEKAFSIFYSIMLNPKDDLSAEEKSEMWNKIKKYDIEYISSGILPSYPKVQEIIERHDILYKGVLMKYLPLCIIIIIFFNVSIIGIITIKTSKSIRYYGIMYIHGMPYYVAILTEGLGMGFNSVVAFMMTVVLLSLQKIFNFAGEINCNIDILELSVMIMISMITVVLAVCTTKGVLKKQPHM